MALPASDTFTGSNQALTTYSANWTNNVGAFRVVSNACCPNYTSGDAAAHWNADTFGDDQYAEATVVAIGSTDYVGVAVRCAASAATFYSFTGNSNDASYLSKYVAGTYTDLGTAAAFAVNDVIRLEAEGTTIRAKINGVTVLSVTDSGITSGYAGVGGAGNAESSRIDGWTAGNLGAATVHPITAWFRRRPAMMIDSWRMATRWADFMQSTFRRLRSAPHRICSSLMPRPTPRRASGCTV